MMVPTNDERHKSIMEKTVTVRITKNYGNEAIYAVNETGQIFANLLGKKTLSRSDIDFMEQLGFAVEVEAPAL